MSEICALEIMQNNNMIKVNENYWLYKISDENTTNIIKEIKLPYKSIKIKTGGKKFDNKFRELMEKSGYISTPDDNYGDSDKFVKTSDIDKFLKKLPKKEIININEKLCWIVEKYIAEKNFNILKIKRIDNRYNRLTESNYITEITNLKIMQNRIEESKRKEEESIKFIEDLFR